jgi:hypothetical protein
MHPKPKRRGPCSIEAVQRAVLALTLESHPRWTPMKDLRREIGCGGVTHHAIRDLIAIGLIERKSATVRPTPAAAHFERLKLP